MKCGHFLRALFPNLLVIGFAIGLGVTSLFFCLPPIIKNSSGFFHICLILLWIIILFLFCMWFWCWCYAVFTDPGRTEDDLKRRGILHQVKQGDIPFCLRSLPICAKCGLPKPATAHHCSTCGACHLRMDHHCGVTGQCVADKNFKSFILNFFYASIYGIFMFISGIITVFKIDNYRVIAVVLMIYSLIIGIALGIFGYTFFKDARSGVGTLDKIAGKSFTSTLSFQKFILSFGNNWFERLIPIQKKTTFLAWPGVSWDDDYEYL